MGRHRKTLSFGFPTAAGEPHVWLWLTRELPGHVVHEVTGPEEVTARELAVLLTRTRRSVRRAIQRGSIKRVGYLPRRGIVVRISEQQIADWKSITPRAAWAAARQRESGLPEWGPFWRSTEELATLLGLHRDTIRARIRAARAPMIEWDRETPFATQQRYYVPDPEIFRRSNVRRAGQKEPMTPSARGKRLVQRVRRES